MKFIAIVAIAMASTIAGSEGLKCHSCRGVDNCEGLEESAKKVDCPHWAKVCGKTYEGEAADEKKVNFRGCFSAMRNVDTNATKVGLIGKEGDLAVLEEFGIRLLRRDELRSFITKGGIGSQKCVRDAKNIETCVCDTDFCNVKGPMDRATTGLRCYSCHSYLECEKAENEMNEVVCPSWANVCGNQISKSDSGRVSTISCWTLLKRDESTEKPRLAMIRTEKQLAAMVGPGVRVLTPREVKSYIGSSKCESRDRWSHVYLCASDLCRAPTRPATCGVRRVTR